MNKRYYIAYGSNLNVPQMKVRCPFATIYKKGELKDYELLFRGNRKNAYLTIEPKEGGVVPVVIWEVTSKDKENLDFYEGYPVLYDKKIVRLPDGSKAFTYTMNNGFDIGAPTDRYVKTCLEGYEYFGFDQEILLGAMPKK